MNQNPKILIVEDLPIWRLLLRRTLEELAITVDEAENGKVAVHKMKQNKLSYEATITDIEMPIMNGLEATRKMRELGFTKPIIGFSSLGEDEDIEKGLEAGMDAYIKKGIDTQPLKDILRELKIL